MWQVGDGATHQAFLAALASPSQGLRVVAKTYLKGVELGEVPIETGTVRVSGRQRIRRTIDDLTVPERYWPASAQDLLSPYGVELRVWRTISLGTRTFPDVPVFTGRIERISRVRRSGQIKIKALDRFAQINDEGFDQIRAIPAGTVGAAITSLILEVFPDASVVDTTGSTVTIPPGLLWRDGDGSRGQAIDDLALAIGAEVVALPDGNFEIRPMPTLADTPVWTVATGVGGVIVRDTFEQARTGVANRWILVGEQTLAGGGPVRAVVTEMHGPLRYGGPYGRVTRRVSSPLFASFGQAEQAGQALRARVSGLARSRDVEMIANPALEAGDVIQVDIPADNSVEVHIADTFDVPLAVTPATMKVVTRSSEV